MTSTQLAMCDPYEARIRELEAENQRLERRLDTLRDVFSVCEVEDDAGGWRIGGAHLQQRVRDALRDARPANDEKHNDGETT